MSVLACIGGLPFTFRTHVLTFALFLVVSFLALRDCIMSQAGRVALAWSLPLLSNSHITIPYASISTAF
ncbi:hypothetical protein BDV32DRAFT_78328 [Aspergillus pseudonomiae]|nr:hypothetical protein BDV32DRAFT_78328 [Aspergillus pseudonomiae]